MAVLSFIMLGDAVREALDRNSGEVMSEHLLDVDDLYVEFRT